MFQLRHSRFAGLAALVAAALALTVPADATWARQDAKKGAQKDDKKVKSSIKITVPRDDAELKIEGQVMKGKGLVRELITPDLDTGKEYEYELSAFWEPNNYTKITRTKKVAFKAGDPVVVDFNKPDPGKQDEVKVRWVPTPQDLVDKMIELGGVKDGDVAYEPGPGDARVLISAAKKGAKKCVGIEIDPKKADDARANIKKEKMEEKVTIRVGDALKVEDYGEATIVFLYMGEEFDLQLRPLLEKQLKPGTRIVSHRFKMGDWEPDKTIKVTSNDDPGYETELHLWIVKEKKK